MSYNPNETAVFASHVSKAYRLFDTPGRRLAWHLFHWQTGSTFTALDDVSFEVKKGESFGIIGRNGSGKSTMLQILAGILKATAGEIRVNGKVAALLELGSGFDPESSGYENIYMNAAILGVSKEKIEQKIGQILEFADIGDFAKQPVKLYSSGMYVRLAFAVAIHVDADILLIDEALAVGDVFFRQKCYQRLEALKKEGRKNDYSRQPWHERSRTVLRPGVVTGPFQGSDAGRQQRGGKALLSAGTADRENAGNYM